MTANQIIAEISHEIGGAGYAHLAMAIDVATKYMPREVSLNEFVYPVVAKFVKKNTTTVQKSIDRAVKNCWDFGNRSIIDHVIGREFHCCPPTKKFILYFAYYLVYNIPYHQIKYAKDGKEYPLIF